MFDDDSKSVVLNRGNLENCGAFLVVVTIIVCGGGRGRECYWHLVGWTRDLDILKVQDSLITRNCAKSGTIFKSSRE